MGVLEQIAGFDNGAPAFLLAVVVVAVLRGTGPAVATAIGSFLAYDFLFIEPLYTLTVSDPAEWLNLLLLLVVGVVIGQLAGRERDRAVAAIEGEREARALFSVSFTLATERDMAAALPAIARMVSRGGSGAACLDRRRRHHCSPTASPPGDRSRPIRPCTRRSAAIRANSRPNGSASTPLVEPRRGRSRDATNAFRVVISADGRALGAVWLHPASRAGRPG